MSAIKSMFGRAAMAAAISVAAVALPSAAVAADAYTTFDGTNGSGGFTYGSTDGTTRTPFTSNGPCVITGTTCLQRTGPSSQNDFLPGVYRNGGGAFTFGTVNVPATSLVLHPGPENFGSPGANLSSVYVAFTAVTAGVYNYSALFTAVDRSPTGVGISSFTLAGVNPLAQLGATTGATYLATGSVTLGVGDVFGFIIDKGATGEYFNDSTSLSFQISAAPEPATWGMMILGFGIAGVALRRRRTIAAIA